MAIEWNTLAQRFDTISKELVDPSLNPQKRQELQKEHSRLDQLLTLHKKVTELEGELTEAQQQCDQATDEEYKLLCSEEFESLQQQKKKAQQDLDDLLFPPDPLSTRSVFLEIRSGAGGQEAALFAADLLKMYTNYALKKNWRVSLVDESTTDLGGIREATVHIQGKGAYGQLMRESGVHRVQRVPKTETQGRVHTSTATVAVLPEAKEVDVKIDPTDLRIDTYRAGGAGGQHVNKTDSAIRITHLPSGVVVTCQEERSQHKNKAKAMKMLQSRLLVAQKEKNAAERGQQRKEMVGTGMRAEKVRTYNYPQNRITDHQVDLTLKKLDIVMEGELDDIIHALMAHEREQRKIQAVK